MTLTFGQTPFGSKSEGQFNFTRRGPDRTLYWEPFAKRVRTEFGGATVADSRRVMALHETDHLMVFYFPTEDVDMEWLAPTDHLTTCPIKGEASYWSVQTGGEIARNAAWAYKTPIDSAPWLAGHIAFDYKQMHAWYQEDEKVYAHPRNPYHRCDIHAASRTVKVRCGDTVVAESTQPRMLFETGVPPRFYLPPDDVRTDLLERSETVSECPYKGDGQHWHLKVGGRTVEDVAWSLPRPLGEAQTVTDYLCFYSGKVEVEVDGERLSE